MEEENIDKEEPDMTEVYTGYYDLTHNGYKEKIVTKVYLEEENEELTEALHKAGNWGTVASTNIWETDNMELFLCGRRSSPLPMPGTRRSSLQKKTATITW
mgnify:CR=1 FL=1